MTCIPRSCSCAVAYKNRKGLHLSLVNVRDNRPCYVRLMEGCSMAAESSLARLDELAASNDKLVILISCLQRTGETCFQSSAFTQWHEHTAGALRPEEALAYAHATVRRREGWLLLLLLLLCFCSWSCRWLY